MTVVYIRADHDENGLETKMFEDLDEFVQEMVGWQSYRQFKDDCEDDFDDELCEGDKHFLELIKKGHHEGEWDDEELYILEGKMTMGVGDA